MDKIEIPLETAINLFDTGLPEWTDMERAISSALQSAVPACSISDLEIDFVEKLFRVWRVEPFMCSSAFRSVEYELSRSRSGKSSHCKGVAVDIICLDNLHRFRLVEAALNAGFTRIGISKNFVHLDSDSSKISQRIWTYDDNNKERKG